MASETLGIVIVHYNTAELLRACLASLRSCTLPRQIVIVDNASTDRAVEALPQAFPEAQWIWNAENLGYARANNQGLRAQHIPSAGRMGPEVALLLNPDTEVRPGALETLAAFLLAHPRVGAVGPRLLNPDGSLQENAFTFPTLWMSFFDFFPLHGRLYHGRLNGRYPEARGEQPLPIDHPLGACLLLRSAALAEVGLLDEGYFMYVEEVDLCYRLKQADWEVWHVPTAEVVHYGGQSTRQMPERMFVELHRSRYRFFRQHYRPAFCRAHRLITRLGLWWRGRQDRRALAQGRLTAAELAGRLAAYGQIAAMR